MRRAVWNIPGGGEADVDGGFGPGKPGAAHYVGKPVAALQPGEHTLVLAYVDATVIAWLDGTVIDRREIDVAPRAELEYAATQSLARVTLKGVKGRITALNLSRDLFYTTTLQSIGKTSMFSSRQAGARRYNEEGNLVIHIEDGYYLMLGDNSPSSSDSRVWGTVPRERLVGRAWIVGWPFSRRKVIK
jgi:hypothetical protein